MNGEHSSWIAQAKIDWGLVHFETSREAATCQKLYFFHSAKGTFSAVTPNLPLSGCNNIVIFTSPLRF